MLQDTNETSIFENSLADLIEKNHRIISFVSDYAEFTDSSKYAMDAAKIQNEYDEKDGVFDEVTMLQSHINYFKQAAANNAQHNSHHGFTLLAMNTASPSWQVISAAKRIFLHWFLPTLKAEHRHHNHQQQQQHLRSSGTPQGPLGSMLFHSCAHYINIPGVTHWCPENLLDISQLTSFYNQIAIEEAYRNSYISDGPYLIDGERSNATVSRNLSKQRKQTQTSLAAFPNAFYLDALDYDGTIRTGPQLLDGTERGDMTNNHTLPHKAARYALVDTILAYNARIACRRRTTNSDGCETLMDRIHVRRTRYTLKRWEEPALGRHVDWPPYKWHQDVFEENENGRGYLTTPR
jgi:hypothetical protein